MPIRRVLMCWDMDQRSVGSEAEGTAPEDFGCGVAPWEQEIGNTQNVGWDST